MLKNEADKLKKEQIELKLATQFTEVSVERRITWHTFDTIAFVLFVGIVIILFM